MAFAQDYVEVADRIAEWYARHPEGRITTELVEMTNDRAVMKAYVFRDVNPEPAGVGHSYLSIPGSTPFTRGSELENAETSAVAALATPEIGEKVSTAALLVLADNMYGWLREPSAVAGGAGETTSVREGAAADEQASGAVAHGEGARAPGVCTHEDTSPLKPDNSAMPAGKVRCLACGVAIAA
jgi:hypothetical protein